MIIRKTCFFSLALGLVLLGSCTETSQLEQRKLLDNPEKGKWIDRHLGLNQINEEFTVIKESCGVFVYPTDQQIAHLKEVSGEDDFYTIADDNNYYFGEAMELLRRGKISIVSPDTRYLLFVLQNRQMVYVDTQSEEFLGWTTILFNADSLPKFVNPVDISNEVGVYFSGLSK